MQKKWLYFVPIGLAALAAGIWFAQARFSPQAPDAPAVAGLWDISFPNLEGHSEPLSRWRGEVLVLNFWASWCAPCREEMPDFASLRAEYRPRGVEFVGLAIDNATSVTQFLQRHPVSYPILVGEGAAHSLARLLGNPSGALPYTVVFDREGKIVLTHLGRLPRTKLETTLRNLSP